MLSKWNGHSGNIIGSKNGYDIIDCKKCGFYHAVPIPSQSEMDNYYKTKYYGQIKPDYFEQHKRDLEWWNITYRNRYELFEKNLPSNRRRILDVGSGPGFFLKYGKDLGWEPLGIEPSQQAADHARGLGLKIINKPLNASTYKELGKFDVVHMHGVLEHILEPIDLVRLCHKLLSDEGLLFMSVANEFSPFQMILKEQCGFEPWWLDPPEHMNYFNVDSIMNLSISCGFTPLDIQTTFPMEIFLLMGDNYIQNKELGRICHEKRKNFEFSLLKAGQSSLKKDLYKSFCDLRIGRQADLLARKEENK